MLELNHQIPNMRLALSGSRYDNDDDEIFAYLGENVTFVAQGLNGNINYTLTLALNDMEETETYTFQSDSAGKVSVPLTAYFRAKYYDGLTYGVTATITPKGGTAKSNYFVLNQLLGLMPQDWFELVPRSEESCERGYEFWGIPNTRYYHPDWVGLVTRWQIFTNAEAEYHVNGSNTNAFTEGQFDVNGYVPQFRVTDEQGDYTMQMTAPNDGSQYVAVQWRAAAGKGYTNGLPDDMQPCLKRALWELVSTTYKSTFTETAEAVGFGAIREATKEAVLAVRGLTAYGVAYYKDIILSEDVRVATYEQFHQADGWSDDYRVIVTTNEVAQTEGDSRLHDLQINIKWCKYGI